MGLAISVKVLLQPPTGGGCDGDVVQMVGRQKSDDGGCGGCERCSHMAADETTVLEGTFGYGDDGMIDDAMTDSSTASLCLWDGTCRDVCGCGGGDDDGLFQGDLSVPCGRTSS